MIHDNFTKHFKRAHVVLVCLIKCVFFQLYVYLCFVEKNIFYPLLFLSVLTEDAPKIVDRFGLLSGSFVVVICGLKCLRSSYSNQNSQYLILIFTTLFFRFDYSFIEETFLVQYFFMSIIFHKFHELLLKVNGVNFGRWINNNTNVGCFMVFVYF